MKEKIGLGIITCNREDLFAKCVKNLPYTDHLIIINDGREYAQKIYPENMSCLIQHKVNVGVGKSKNEALRFLRVNDCSHIFLMEDDMQVIDSNICEAYIAASKASGIRHFNFAYHGPLNKKEDGSPNPRKKIAYNSDVEIGFHFNLGAAFSYYHMSVIDQCGYMDERFYNFFEHVDHTYRIIKAGFHPAMGWFADIADSYNYLFDLDPDLKNSSIKRNILWHKIKFRYYQYIFENKNGKMDKSAEEPEVLECLERIRKKYGPPSLK